MAAGDGQTPGHQLADRVALLPKEAAEAVGAIERPPRFALSVTDAAAAVAVSPRLFYRLLAEDHSLPRVYLGRRVVIPARALEDWINRRAGAERTREHRAVLALQGIRR